MWDADEPEVDASASVSNPTHDEPPVSPTPSEDADDDASDAEGAGDVADDVFAALLSSLRALPGPCAPPIGEGAFDILYASAREIVVWFASAREGIAQREVVIPARLARRAWGVLLRGAPVDEGTLQALAAGPAGGRWLLALFAQLPGVEVRAPAGADAASETITLRWRGEAGAPREDSQTLNGGTA